MYANDRGPEVVVTLSDEVPEEQREAIRASVSDMAKRTAEASRLTFERNRVLADLARRMNAPLKALIANDDDAAAALAAAEQTTDSTAPLPPGPDWPAVTFVPDTSTRSEDGFTAHQVFGTPWHYQWQWNAGHPPITSAQDRPNGRIELFIHADQTTNRSDAHGGFGVALTSQQVQLVAARSLRRTNHRYYTYGGPLGGNATVEGGTELTAIQSGTVLSSARDRRFRRRVSSGEEVRYDNPGWDAGEAIQVDWVMIPGRVYTLNVGCWLFGEAHGGLGTASIAQARINGLVTALVANFTD